MLGTVEAVRRQPATLEGFVRRYPTAGDHAGLDGLDGDEGGLPALLVVDGRRARSDRPPGQAHGLFGRFLALRTDLGLLAEEYDHVTGWQLGNFPQAYSHIGVIGSALLLQQLGSGAPAAEAEVLLAADV
uniref:GH15-like domain-containing protein n=1 Tax=Streptomyces avermitilis TaxID=33903 RepID=A0A499VDA0_STRAX|nr:hypothetical protein SAVMC3_01300 [Streptomyces avermitilis]